MNVPEAVAFKEQQKLLCNFCGSIIKKMDEAAKNVSEYIFKGMNKGCVVKHFGNATAVELCQKDVKNLAEKVQSYIDEAGAPKTVCEKLHFC